MTDQTTTTTEPADKRARPTWLKTRGGGGRLRWVCESCSLLPPGLTADGRSKGRAWWWAARRDAMEAEARAAGWTVEPMRG